MPNELRLDAVSVDVASDDIFSAADTVLETDEKGFLAV